MANWTEAGVAMPDAPGDTWAAWLDHQRFSGGEQEERLKQTLREYRATVLDNADIEVGDTVLDVGAGDGFIALGALERVGEDGTVIFSDVSDAVLERARTTAEDLGLLEQCEFVIAPAEELEPIGAESVDSVTLRSVLIFVQQKEQAFAEFFRVLKPGGRLSIYEPIGSFTGEMEFPADAFLGYRIEQMELEIPEEIREMYRRMRDYGREHSPERETAMDFGERDLFTLAQSAGFENVHLQLHSYHTWISETEEWEPWLTTSFGPGAPTKQEAMDATLSTEEQDTFEEYVRPLLEKPTPKRNVGTPAYLWAEKPPS